VLLDARRAEDIAPSGAEEKKDEERMVPIGLGDLQVPEGLYREMMEVDEEAEREYSGAEQQQGHPSEAEEYGSSSFTVGDK
jgi:hypothetical protein